MKYSTSKNIRRIRLIFLFLGILAFGTIVTIFGFYPDENGNILIEIILIGISIALVGLVGIVVSIIGLVKKKASIKNIPADNTAFNESVVDNPDEEVTYYFGYCGKMNQSYRMEDANAHVVYECNLKKFNLFGADEFEFINHLTNKTETHLLGKTVSTTDGNIISNSSFKYDKIDIFAYLENYGYVYRTTKVSLSPEFTIFKDGYEILKMKFKAFAPKSGEPGIKKSSNVIINMKKKYIDIAVLSSLIVIRAGSSVTSM